MKKIVFILCIIIIFLLPINISGENIDIDFYELFDNHSSILLIYDTNTGDIEYANATAASFYGYTKEQLETMNIYEINLLTKQEIDLEIQKAKEEQRNYYVFKHRLANGEVRIVEDYTCTQNNR